MAVTSIAVLDGSDNIINVIGLKSSDVDDGGTPSDAKCSARILEIYGPGTDTNLYIMYKDSRVNEPGVGGTYDRANDKLIKPKEPHFAWPSYTLNTTTWQWDPPTPYPTDGQTYGWDEDTLSWVLTDPQF